MKKFLFAFIFISNLAWPSDYYIYGDLSKAGHAKEIFSSVEEELLSKLGMSSQVYRIQSSLDLAELKKKYHPLKVEPVSVIKLLSHQDKQWYRSNTGETTVRWITDIDTQLIRAKKGEDLQLIEDDEVQRKKIKVAIIDSGVDTTHQDLTQNIARKPKECTALKKYRDCVLNSEDNNQCHELAIVDTDNNGYPLDCEGWSFTKDSYLLSDVSGNPEVDDNEGHGTHVAGIVAAAKNDYGITGVAKNVAILPIQVASGSLQDSPIETIAKGLLYAIHEKVDIINLSLGWRFEFDSLMIRNLIKKAIERNIIVVVAAGNTAHSDVSYPCAYPDVLCVASHDQKGELSSFSNRGGQVDIIAPGENILSTWTSKKRSKLFTEDNQHEYMSGTSQAAPMASGVIARLLSRGYSPQHAAMALRLGARPKEKSSLIQFGNIDYKRSLEVKDQVLIIPKSKEAYLVNYNAKEYSFDLGLKNLGTLNGQENIAVKSLTPLVKVKNTVTKLASLAPGESTQIKVNFTVDKSETINKEIYFQVKVAKRTYKVRVDLITIILPDQKSATTNRFDIKTQLESAESFRAFDNIGNQDATIDFLTYSSDNQSTFVSVLQNHEGRYRQSRSFEIKHDKVVFLNLSKIDLDSDGYADYVITYVFVNKEGNKITKFLVFDHDLQIKRILIAPLNEYKNDITFMPGKFKWIKERQRYYPMWIGYGENASPLTYSPWGPKPLVEKNYIYIMRPSGLSHISLPEGEFPIHTLTQNKEQIQNGVVHLITAKGQGFIKDYTLYKLDGELQKLDSIYTSEYFDLFYAKPLPMISSYPNAHFDETSNSGTQYVFTLDIINDVAVGERLFIDNPFKDENIKFVPRIDEDSIFYQTEFKIVYQDLFTNKSSWLESRVDTKRRRFTPLKNNRGLYLSHADTPGIASEVLIVDRKGKLMRSAKNTILALKGCQEVGLVSQREQDLLAFICAESKQLILHKIEL